MGELKLMAAGKWRRTVVRNAARSWGELMFSGWDGLKGTLEADCVQLLRPDCG